MGSYKWTVEPHDVDSAVRGNELRVQFRVRKYSTLKVWITSNGKEIQNADGSTVTLEWKNPTRPDRQTREIHIAGHVNGKAVTDFKAAIIRHDQHYTLACAAFEDGAMKPMGDWLLANGFGIENEGFISVQNHLLLMAFESDEGSLFTGACLNVLATVGNDMPELEVGSLLTVKDGRIAKADSWLGEAYYFSSSDVEPDGKGSWTSREPFNGEVKVAAIYPVGSPN